MHFLPLHGWPCLLIAVGLLAAATYAAEPPYIFGVHDLGGAATMEQCGKRGWIVVTVEIGHDPTNHTGGNFSSYANKGHGVIVRLNNGYGSAGTLPVEAQYANFAARCANYVAATTGADIFIIGNETNLPREWPGNIDGRADTGEPITAARYITCYNLCYDAIKNVRTSAQVCPSPSGTWAPPYPAQGIPGFLDYWLDILNGIGANRIDALILHAYTHGCNPSLVTSNALMDYPYNTIYYNFRVYRNYMAAIPSAMRSKPVYITECDQNVECADPPPNPRHTWFDSNNGWTKAIYSEIDNWNKGPANQKIRCVVLFRWDDVPEGEWNFGFSNRPGVIADWVEAMSNNYRWDIGSKGTIAGTVKNTSGQPIAGARVVTSPGGYIGVSGGNGAYTISEVPIGVYDVTASRIGFSPVTYTNRTLLSGTPLTLNFALVSTPVVTIDSVATPAEVIIAGESGIPVSVTVTNLSAEDVHISQARPTFWLGTADVTGLYSSVSHASNPARVPAGGSAVLQFTVAASPDAPYGATRIDAEVVVWPNAVVNGSFEEGGAVVPPTHWANWSNQPALGPTWTYDAAYRTDGTRSYRLGLANAPNGVYCTANTGDGTDLLPVIPGTQYNLAMSRRAVVSAGSPQFMLVFAEYDSSRSKIGSDKYTYFTASAEWQEAGATYTTSATAAFARLWFGMWSGGTTSAHLWADNVRLQPVGLTFADSGAASFDTWAVGMPADTIQQAKDFEDFVYLKLTGKRISARYAGSFYVQEPDGSSGIRVDGSTSFELGEAVDIAGVIVSDGAERFISPVTVSASD